jgi:hypothetical protein
MKQTGIAAAGLLAVLNLASAEQLYDLGDVAKLGLSGFGKEEVYRQTNRSYGLLNCAFSPDPRGVLGASVSGGPYCQPGPSGTASGPPFNLIQATGDLSHEFDSAWKIDYRLTYRARNGQADIYGQPVVDRNLGISHPQYGELRAGTILSRSWSRSDSFSYPLGMSQQWSETGAGYGMFLYAARYTSPTFELGGGKKIVLEGTYASDKIHYGQNASLVAYNEAPPRPKLGELFIQYSDTSNLVEYIFQTSRGGQQSSFAKGAFTGDVGNTDNLGNLSAGTSGFYILPHENLHILQGNHYFNEHWVGTFGIRRNYWSGVSYQCEYVAGVGCYFPSGFNNAVDGIGHKAWSMDAFGGIRYISGIWTYTLGGVRLNKAHTNSPTEYGQSNTATFINLGVYRKVPEIYKNAEVYAGLGQVRFGSYGPAPLSMPNELADFGVDPRSNSWANLLTIGANLLF